MTIQFRSLLIGLGNMGSLYSKQISMKKTVPFVTHSQVLSSHPSFYWHSAFDKSPDAVNFIQKEYRVPFCFSDIESIPDLDKIEVLVLATPPSFRSCFFKFLPNLRAVLVEKPLGSSFSESLAFQDERIRRNLITQVNLTRRSDTYMQMLSNGLLNREIGSVQFGFATYGNGIINYATHLIDLVRMLIGEVTSVQSISDGGCFKEGPLKNDLNFSFHIFINEIVISFHPLKFSQYREGSLDLWGDQGRLQILQEGLRCHINHSINCRSLDNAMELNSDSSHVYNTEYGHALYSLYNDLAISLSDSSHNTCSPCSSALYTEYIVHQIIYSFNNNGQRIDLKKVI